MSTNEQWRVDPDLPTMVIDQQGEAVAGVFYGHPKSLEDGEARIQLAEKRARLIAQAPAMARFIDAVSCQIASVLNEERFSLEYRKQLLDDYKSACAILSQLEAKP